jgi:hypothetical protein
LVVSTFNVVNVNESSSLRAVKKRIDSAIGTVSLQIWERDAIVSVD